MEGEELKRGDKLPPVARTGEVNSISRSEPWSTESQLFLYILCLLALDVILRSGPGYYGSIVKVQVQVIYRPAG
jgi:hypothetical protein